MTITTAAQGRREEHHRMKSTTALILSAALSAATLTGCASGRVAPTETVTVTAPAEDDGERNPTDYEIAGLAMEMAWNDMESYERVNICMGWNLMDYDEQEALMADIFVEGDSVATLPQVRAFFDKKCSR